MTASPVYLAPRTTYESLPNQRLWRKARRRRQLIKRYLDRYEVVAVAHPGAAAILFLWYLHPEILRTTKFELKDVSVGTLGIFAIAALIVSQVVQAVANLREEAQKA